jgi:hypothetical protein
MIAGDDDRWNQPFETIRDGEQTVTTHSQIAEHACRRWLATPVDCQSAHAEGWSWCLAAAVAGLGFRLHDNRHGTDYHERASAPWWAAAREHCLDRDLPVATALATAFHAAPQYPDDALALFEAGCRSIGLGTDPHLPLTLGRGVGSALVLAREWGLDDVAAWLATAIDASYEPTWERTSGEFTFRMGLDEMYPSGRFDALLAAGEAAGPGAWTRLSEAPLERCPQLVGVDFPTMAFTRAEWVDGNLRLRLAPLHEDPSTRTGFRIVGAEPRNWDVHGMDGISLDLSTTGLDVRVPLIAGDLELIRSSY